jgi:hypothetical protein
MNALISERPIGTVHRCVAIIRVNKVLSKYKVTTAAARRLAYKISMISGTNSGRTASSNGDAGIHALPWVLVM